MRYVLLQILFVLFISLFIYFLFSPYFKNFMHEEAHGESKDIEELSSLLSKAAEFYSKDFTIYHKDYLYIAGKESDSLLKITKKGEDFSVKLEKEFRTWEAIRKNGKEEFCLSFLGNTSCSNITAEYESPFKTLESSITTKEWVERLFIKKFELLEKRNALEIQSVKEKNYSIGMCKEFSLKYDLKRLSVSDLKEIDIDPSSPIASAEGVEEKVCIDDKGRIIYREMSYEKPYKSIQRFEMVYYSETPEPIEFLETSTSLNQLIRAANQFLGALTQCRNQGDDKCFRSLAINAKVPEVCKESKDPIKCLDAYAAFLEDKSVCAYFEEYNTTPPKFCSEEPAITDTNPSPDANDTLNGTMLNETMEG